MGDLRRVKKSVGNPTVQIDTLVAVCKMTRRDVFLERDHMMNLLMLLPIWNGIMPTPTILKPKLLWSGKQLFSQIIPDEIEVIRTHYTHPENEDESSVKWISPGDTKVLIERGELICGIMCKKSLEINQGSLVHVVKKELGCQRARIFIDHLSIVTSKWLDQEGHTIRIDDVASDVRLKVNIRVIIEEAKRAIKQTRKELSELSPQFTNMQIFEDKVNSTLRCASNAMIPVVQRSFSQQNNLWNMLVSGANVCVYHLLQIKACLGQQCVMGKRIPFGFRGRPLPHFVENDYGIETGGFVENCFVDGLLPTEFFFHAMAARDNVVNNMTNINSIHRQTMNSMGSLKVKDNGSVEDGAGQVIQFLYGEDGIKEDATEMQIFPTISLSDRTFRRKFKFELWNERQLISTFEDKVFKKITQTDEAVVELEKEWQTLRSDRETLRSVFTNGDNKATLPCNLLRILRNAKKIFSINQRSKIGLSPLRVLEGVSNLIQNRLVIAGTDRLCRLGNENGALLFQCLLRSMLCTRRVAEDFRLSTQAFDWILDEIEARFRQARVQPGEMVGKLAARSFGEVATQLSVNTFHHVNISASNVTLGIPRLKEIIDASKRLKTPSLTIFLTGDAAKDAEKANDVLCRLERTTLRKVIMKSAIYYDPHLTKTVVAEDQDLVDSYYEMPDFEPTNLSPWMLRIELNQRVISNLKLRMEKICEKIHAEFGDDLDCKFTDDNAEKLVFQIRIKIDEKDTLDDAGSEVEMRDEEFLILLSNGLLSDLTLRGIESIRKVYLYPPGTSDRKRIMVTEKGWLETIDECVLETEGSNLMKALCERDVDPIRTYSNDIRETCAVLGVEAGRKSLEKEIKCVLFFDGSYIDYRHLSLLCDVMTAKGQLTAMARRAISRRTSCTNSFYERKMSMPDAYYDNQTRTGASRNVMMDQLTNFETNIFESTMDEEISRHHLNVAIDLKTSMGKAAHFDREDLLAPGQYPRFAQAVWVNSSIAGVSSYRGKLRSRVTPTTRRLLSRRSTFRLVPDARRGSYFRRRELPIQNNRYSSRQMRAISRWIHPTVGAHRRRFRVQAPYRSLIKQFLLYDN